MALSKEISAFNIDAILASTADQTPQELELMKPFRSYERGLKAYEDRHERLHVQVLFKKIKKYLSLGIRGISGLDKT